MNLMQRALKRFERNGRFDWMPDKLYLQVMYFANMRKVLNLRKPKAYSEKLQWLKLYDRKPEYITMVDKCDAKLHVAAQIGEEYIIPTLGVWDHFDDIDFDALPESFVLKTTHDCGGVVLCEDKSRLDMEAAREKVERHLKRDYFKRGREWPYKNVKRRIIAEKYMKNLQTQDLRDYKFFCFDGQVKALFIATERQAQDTETKFDFFDAEYNHLPFTNGHPNADKLPEKPACFEEMKRLASKLSKGIPHVRVDFYEVEGKVYFGEMTFSHWSGMVPFEPEEWDRVFGDWIKLPDRRKQ